MWIFFSSIHRIRSAFISPDIHTFRMKKFSHYISCYITYIHNWPLQPFSQNYGLASHTTHVVWVNFIRRIRTTEFLRNFFKAGLFTLRVFIRNLLRGSRRRNIFHISFLMTDLGYEPSVLRLISRYTTYYPLFEKMDQRNLY